MIVNDKKVSSVLIFLNMSYNKSGNSLPMIFNVLQRFTNLFVNKFCKQV